MDRRKAFGDVMRFLRMREGLAQEDFSNISSRGYISDLERGLFRPTLDKVDSLCTLLKVHPASFVTLMYLSECETAEEAEVTLKNLQSEVKELLAGFKK